MRTKILFCLMLMILGNGSMVVGQDDNYVWRNAKWGMTEQDVLLAFKGEAVIKEYCNYPPESYSNITIPKYDINSDIFMVTFFFSSKTNKLCQIELRLIDENNSLNHYLNSYNKILELLILKYGQPDIRNDKDTEEIVIGRLIDKELIWRFESTKILLKFSYSEMVAEVVKTNPIAFYITYTDIKVVTGLDKL